MSQDFSQVGFESMAASDSERSARSAPPSYIRNINALMATIGHIADKFIETGTKFDPDTCGLDRRAAKAVWVGGITVLWPRETSWLAVRKEDQMGMESYGGLGVVVEPYRVVLGDWVIYRAEAPRVFWIIQKSGLVDEALAASQGLQPYQEDPCVG